MNPLHSEKKSEKEFQESRKEQLKTLIKRLHSGESPDNVKQEFKTILGTVDPEEISRIEEELIKEGMPREKIQSLCEVHLAVFKESLDQDMSLPEGHPLHILMEEHKMMTRFADEVRDLAKNLREPGPSEKEGETLKSIVHHLKESESHYVREENVLFPFLEDHGITQPPAIMWMEHDTIRRMKKEVFQLVDTREDMDFAEFQKALVEATTVLAETLSNHFYKENKILFPTALQVLSEDEWTEIRHQFDELGYCCFSPQATLKQPTPEKEARIAKGTISLETGTFSLGELESLLNTVPMDITFVDKEDTVRYFNKSEERIFPRTKAVIGRKVQNCHPQKSVHVVNKILDEFKSGTRDTAEFWIEVQGRLVYIRYFALRGNDNEYLGCLEVTQDITDIQKITGEKRLLS
jgi:PAS domain S-box-containing protein